MVKPRVLQLFAAGINCDRELRFALESAGARVEEIHIHQLLQQPDRIRECDVFAIPGGFSYGDSLGAGNILAMEVERHLGDLLQEHHEAGGSIFGVCNGFQALVKSGILPDLENLEVSLTWNVSHRFECRWSRLRVAEGLATVLPPGMVVAASSAHAEGRLVFSDPGAPRLLAEQNRIAFYYADETGQATTEFPHCPNGSAGGIAGLVSGSGRIVGLMPHLERNYSAAMLPDRGAGSWGTGGEGIRFFKGLLAPYSQSYSRSQPLST